MVKKVLCGDCNFYLIRGKCPRAIYVDANLNRVACHSNDKICGKFKSRVVKRALKHFDKGSLPHYVFDGSDYVPKLDRVRLTGQILRIFNFMLDGEWHTLGEIEFETGDPQASISAQLRHLRKDRFGNYTVLKRRKGIESKGLWEYQLVI